MKLYFSPGTCALAPHIILLEGGIPHQLEKVDLRAKTFAGGDYKKVNPKGSVPAVEIEGGEVLTENAVILQYLADLRPDMGLVPIPGSFARYRTLEMVNFITTEVHKSYSILFGAGRMVKQADGNAELKASVRDALATKYELLTAALGDKEFLMKEGFTIADAYLYTVTRWSKMMEVDLARFPKIQAYMKRVENRPSVSEALKAEGLPPF